jgi:hypothetical protein
MYGAVHQQTRLHARLSALAASAHTTQSLAHSSPVLRFGRSAAGLLGPDAITEIAVVVTRPPHGRWMEEAYEGQNS